MDPPPTPRQRLRPLQRPHFSLPSPHAHPPALIPEQLLARALCPSPLAAPGPVAPPPGPGLNGVRPYQTPAPALSPMSKAQHSPPAASALTPKQLPAIALGPSQPKVPVPGHTPAVPGAGRLPAVRPAPPPMPRYQPHLQQSLQPAVGPQRKQRAVAGAVGGTPLRAGGGGTPLRAGPPQASRRDKGRPYQPHLQPKLKPAAGLMPRGQHRPVGEVVANAVADASEAALRAAPSPALGPNVVHPSLQPAAQPKVALSPDTDHSGAAQIQQPVQGQAQQLSSAEVQEVLTLMKGRPRAAPLVRGNPHECMGCEETLKHGRGFKYYLGPAPETVAFRRTQSLGVGSFGVVYR